jgi:hypothetical protein
LYCAGLPRRGTDNGVSHLRRSGFCVRVFPAALAALYRAAYSNFRHHRTADPSAGLRLQDDNRFFFSAKSKSAPNLLSPCRGQESV